MTWDGHPIYEKLLEETQTAWNAILVTFVIYVINFWLFFKSVRDDKKKAGEVAPEGGKVEKQEKTLGNVEDSRTIDKYKGDLV